MFNHFFRFLSRKLWNTRKFSLLNIFGLAAGLGAALAIYLVIHYENGFDRFYPGADRIYRVTTTIRNSNGEIDYEEDAPLPLPAAIQQNFPQLEAVASLWSQKQAKFLVPGGAGLPEKKFEQRQGTFYMNPAGFRIFELPWLAGNPSKALTDPNTAVLTRSVAENWFGHWQDAMGKTIRMGDLKKPFLITGILRDPPANTDIPLRVMLSYATFVNAKDHPLDNWGYFNSNSECFVLLAKGQDIQPIRSQLPAFEASYFNAKNGFDPKQVSMDFQPLDRMHFDERFTTYAKKGISENECWSLGIIGIFLVFMACINFINMSTAQSISRSREIGVRKVLGGSRVRLLWQSLCETGVLVLIALVVACLMVKGILPLLNNLLDKQLSFRWFDPLLLLSLLATWIAVTFLAGFYPGMILSGLKPIRTIRYGRKPVGNGLSLRRGLVVIQFAIAQLLLVGTFVIVKQIKYFREFPTGFDTKAIVLVDIPDNPENKSRLATLKNKIQEIPGVLQASFCSDPPSHDGAWETGFIFDSQPGFQPFNVITRYGDADYLQTFHMKLLIGRYPAPSDTTREIVVNETTVKKLGLKSPDEILNKTIRFGEGPGYPRYPIVGVLADFNSRPLRQQIEPIVITPNLYAYEKLAVRLDPQKTDISLARVKKAYAELFPDRIFDYDWFDDTVASFYEGEALAAALFKIFAAIALLISCLGLYGLVSLMTLQKTKEVGIRKVLGASVTSIVYLFSREFTWLITISFLIAAPLGFYFMSHWLSGFYYRTDIGWTIFAGTLLSSLFVAWISVGQEALKAGLSNPVKSLRAE